MGWPIIVETLLNHSEATAIVLLGLYIVYEVRIGVMQDVRESQRTIGVALYRVIENDTQLDEEAFRQSLWGEESQQKLFFNDLSVAPEGPDEEQRRQEHRERNGAHPTEPTEPSRPPRQGSD